MRVKQLQHRVVEFRRCLDGLDALNGHDTHILGGCLDLSRLTAAGHSFGATTATQTAAADDRIRAVIAYDMWMEPMDKSTMNPGGGAGDGDGEMEMVLDGDGDGGDNSYL